jgi:phosphate transport system substrate-binding protein
VEPKFDTISSGEYPLSRSLFFYIKNDHLGSVPGLDEYVKLFMSDRMIGKNGYLTKIGLVPLPDNLRKASQERVLNFVPLTLEGGKLSTLEEYAKQKDLVTK